MKYQIQTYSGSQATSGIDVVAETEGVLTQNQINEWYYKAVGEKDPPVGLQYTLVPENHAWFKTEDGQGTLGSNENLRTRSTAAPAEGVEIPTDELLVRENQNRLKERVAMINYREKVAKAMKELQASR